MILLKIELKRKQTPCWINLHAISSIFKQDKRDSWKIVMNNKTTYEVGIYEAGRILKKLEGN